jgi:ferric-dicitrate binding protein FerR (iron transport regulator)
MTELNIPFGDGQDEPPASRGRKVSMKKWYWAAAAIVFFAIAGFVWINNNKGEIKEEAIAQSNEVSTRRGSKSTVHLPDGTIVVLNAGSKLTYNKDFGKELREVTLSGEGFFDVKRMSQKPFVIHTESINIKVLGTVFNVKAYPEDKRTETSLIHGSIEVTMKNRPNDKIILAPSEKLVVENNTVVDKTVTTTKGTEIPEVSINTLMSVNKLRYNEADSSVAETGWVDNKLVFRDESFEDLVRKMERWYDVDIEISDARLREKRLNGTFEKETIDQALEALKILSPFRYEQTGNKIIIHR